MKGLNTLLQRSILAVLNVNIFVMACGIALLSKVYTIKFDVIGIPGTQFGWIFNVFNISVSIMCLIFGMHISPMGSTFLLNLGLLIMAGVFVSHGLLLDIEEDSTTTFWISLVLQTVAGIGKAAFNISYTCIICREFKGAVVFVFAFVEISFGLGNLLGRPVGEFLYGLGGFNLPFLAISGFVLVCFPLNYLVLP